MRGPVSWRPVSWKPACRWGLAAALLLLVTLAAALAFEWLRLPDVEKLRLGVSYSTVILDREGNALRYALTAEEQLAPRIRLAAIHPRLVQATLAAEDARFRSHGGVDLRAVARALWLNFKAGRVVSGASTITMQAARLLRPLPRGYYNKLREMLLAWWLEKHLAKDEILELYFNLAPYGGNIRGAEGAALRYFGRHAGDLSLGEAALLAGLPQSPSRLRPDRAPARARRRRDWILDRMAVLGWISPQAGAEAKAAPVEIRFHPLPLRSPHFAEWARWRSAPGERVRTTLDPALQKLAEETMAAWLAELRPHGVQSGALVAVETWSGRIRALVGSRDFFAPGNGQVNGAAAPRSPGSLLKPFIYALAFERGIIRPETILRDQPLRFRDGWQPQNFSRQFSGSVTAREALLSSLNAPALELLERVGVADAITALRSAGLRHVRATPERYGLALGLGGVEVPLLELVEAYATLGRLGSHRALAFREEEPSGSLEPVLDPGAVYQVAEILEGGSWPEVEKGGPLKLPRLALKTGTSFGRRDAWAVGFNPSWTVGVWLGNCDASPSIALVGRSAAVPAVLAFLRRLPPLDLPPWYAPPAGSSHLIPTIAPVPPIREDSRVQWISPIDGALYLAHDRPGGNRLRLQAEVTPAGRLSWFIDGAFAGRSASGEVLEAPLEAGAHQVTLLTERGHMETRRIRVKN
ncbi:MAG: penicillin-binding protein 1C [Planctomycetes bacterium]|nr:penicillin-binding protein 1C [Planctomycetota bacterium]